VWMDKNGMLKWEKGVIFGKLYFVHILHLFKCSCKFKIRKVKTTFFV
jgi:hypothetical protein